MGTVRYNGSRHPGAAHTDPIETGANCQSFAYAVLSLFGVGVAPHRSSELWDDPSLPHAEAESPEFLDLALFNRGADAWGAHVAVVLSRTQLLHLCAEVGRPALWSWDEFAGRRRYRRLVGVVRAGSRIG